MELTAAQKKVLTALSVSPAHGKQGAAYPKGLNGTVLENLRRQGLVTRCDFEWSITEAGRAALAK